MSSSCTGVNQVVNRSGAPERGSRDVTEEIKLSVKNAFAMFDPSRSGSMDVSQLKVSVCF